MEPNLLVFLRDIAPQKYEEWMIELVYAILKDCDVHLELLQKEIAESNGN